MAQEAASGDWQSDTGRDTPCKASGEAGFLGAGYSSFDDTGRDNPETRCSIYVCGSWRLAADDTGHDGSGTVIELLWRPLYQFFGGYHDLR